jgi:hypothetical protein
MLLTAAQRSSLLLLAPSIKDSCYHRRQLRHREANVANAPSKPSHHEPKPLPRHISCWQLLTAVDCAVDSCYQLLSAVDSWWNMPTAGYLCCWQLFIVPLLQLVISRYCARQRLLVADKRQLKTAKDKERQLVTRQLLTAVDSCWQRQLWKTAAI